MSLRSRLTLSFTCLFGSIVLGLAIASYILVRNSLYADLNTEVQVAVDATALSAEHEFREHTEVAGGEADLQEILRERQQASLPDMQIVVRDGARLVGYRSAANAPVTIDSVPSNQLRTRSYRELRLAFRSLPVKKFGKRYDIFAAAPITGVAARLHRFGILLAFLVPLGLLLAASAGYLLARNSLAPLNELRLIIDAVSSSDLTVRVRVPVPGNDNEVGIIGKQFNALLERLQRAFDSRQRFMADASHELRTPVTVALTTAQVTLRDTQRTQRDSDEGLRLIEEQMLRVKKIVEDLLLLSQADASSLHVTMEDVYLDDIVAEVSRAARTLAADKGVALKVEALPEARIQGDSGLLGQAVMILLDNAVKFTPAGGGIMTGIQRHGDEWVCYVEDTGPGIPEAAQPYIFDRFYHAGKDSGGAGLGLAIAKVIVESHSGKLRLSESKPGFTRFEIALVALEEQAERPQPKAFAVRI